MDPITLAVVGMAVGSAFSAAGSYQSGQAAAQAARYNADLADKNAELAIQQGLEEERRSRVIARKTIGIARANYGASGVAMEGSAMDVLAESAAAAERDAITIKNNSYLKADALRAEARMERSRGEAASTAGTLGAIGAIFSGAGSIGLAMKRT